MKNKIIITSIVLFFILISFTFLLTHSSSGETTLLEKTEKEIEYLEEKVIEIMNNLNQITLSNSILVEEKTEKSSQSNQENQNEQQSSNSDKSKGEQNSQSSKSSSNETGSSTGNTTEESTKYEIINDSILANDNKKIDWRHIKSNIESIHTTWATLTIDLHALNVKNEDILNFSGVLDQVTINAKQENKIATLNNLASLYAFFPNYISQISEDYDKINIHYTKACVLNSYALAEQDKWEDMKLQATNSINYFTNILNSVNAEIQNKGNVNKIYVLLNELNNSIDVKDKDLYMIKYRNVMEELLNF